MAVDNSESLLAMSIQQFLLLGNLLIILVGILRPSRSQNTLAVLTSEYSRDVIAVSTSKHYIRLDLKILSLSRPWDILAVSASGCCPASASH
jgi:hypothetical protein